MPRTETMDPPPTGVASSLPRKRETVNLTRSRAPGLAAPQPASRRVPKCCTAPVWRTRRSSTRNLVQGDAHGPSLLLQGVQPQQTVVVHISVPAFGRAVAVQHAPDPGIDLPGPARLDDVVVRTGLQADDHVDGVAACCEVDDRDVADGTQPAQHLHTVDVRKHDIEQDQVGALQIGAAQPGTSCALVQDFVTLASEREAQSLPK